MDAVDVGLSSPDKRHEDTPSNPPRTPLSLDQATIILAKHTLATPCLKVLHHDRILNPRNTTYTLTSSDGKDYILRFSESWGTKTENEVAAISYIAKNTSLPVPKVVGFCTDSAESPTKYEYILMEKLRGVPIGYLFKNLSLSKKITVVRNMTKILKIFQSLTFDQCGSFYFNKTDTESKVEMKDVKVGPLFRSPHCSPFSNYLEYLQQLINSGIERMQTSRILMDGEGPVLLERIQNFRDKVCNLETTPLSEKVKNVQFVFTHLDLHSFNILIDEETFEITGVIDFEFSGVHPIDQDWFECFSFAGICNKSRDVFGDGMRTMSDSGTGFDSQKDQDLPELKVHFFQECKIQGVQTPEDIIGHEERAMLHYFVKYIYPWWITEEVDDPLPEKWILERNSIRERLKVVLDMYGV